MSKPPAGMLWIYSLPLYMSTSTTPCTWQQGQSSVENICFVRPIMRKLQLYEAYVHCFIYSGISKTSVDALRKCTVRSPLSCRVPDEITENNPELTRANAQVSWSSPVWPQHTVRLASSTTSKTRMYNNAERLSAHFLRHQSESPRNDSSSSLWKSRH